MRYDQLEQSGAEEILKHIARNLGIGLIVVAVWLSVIPKVDAQDAVPTEILQRTLLIKVGNEGGTAFSIDYRGDLYLVTARHVVAELPAGRTTIQIWQSGQWKDLSIVRTTFPASADVDIAVLSTEEKVSVPFHILVSATDEGPTMGQQVWFLGYPFADPKLTTPFLNQQVLPFIKRGTMSAIDGSNQSAVVLYIDGFNNPGFSGGPIIYWDFKKQAYRIFGVVKGYRTETAKIAVNGKLVDSDLLVNSGILVGYSVTHAVEAIESSLRAMLPAR